ncbi:MAG: hypothetical protein FWF01_02655 [Alphaproteobacteria bacterium]|nr:hypothetical protein [Alphaproteobacteria bacterium]
MPLYHTLATKLRKLSLVEFACVKIVYIIFAMLVAGLFPDLLDVSGWAYLVLTLVAAAPLWVHLASFQGNIISKARQYLKHNDPAHQALTLISCFSFGLLLAVLFPLLAMGAWWVYILLMVAFAIAPASKVLFR